MIHCTFKWFTDALGHRVFALERAVNDDNEPVVLPCGSPYELGAIIRDGEWVIMEDGEEA
jgi:hypothetical protein